MHHDPGTRRAAFIERRMWHVTWDEDLVARLDKHSLLEVVAVINRTFTGEHVSDCFDALVIMSVRSRVGRHGKNIHANLRSADSFRGSARAIGETLLTNIRLAWSDHLDAL